MTKETKKQNVAYSLAEATEWIERGENGRPVRPIVTQGHRKPVGKFVSLKCGMAMPWESFHELHLMWLSEADTCVERFLAQPFRMFFTVKGESKVMKYVPDLERRFTDGRVEVVEIKRTVDEATREQFYADKLARARRYGGRHGFRFRVMTAEKHIAGIALRNAEAIVRDRFTAVTIADLEAFYTAAGSRRTGSLPFAKTVEILSARGDRFDPCAKAKLHAMIVRRVASLDITRPVKDDTPITMTDTRRRAA